MPTFRNSSTLEVRELPQELIDAWNASGNPKAAVWVAYTPPEPEVVASPVPNEVGPYQIREAMLDKGFFTPSNHVAAYEELDAWIDGLIDTAIPVAAAPAQNAKAKRAWRMATGIKRSDAFVEIVRVAAGKTAAETDELFRYAYTV